MSAESCDFWLMFCQTVGGCLYLALMINGLRCATSTPNRTRPPCDANAEYFARELELERERRSITYDDARRELDLMFDGYVQARHRITSDGQTIH